MKFSLKYSFFFIYLKKIQKKQKEFEEFLSILQKYYKQSLNLPDSDLIIFRVSGYHADYFIKNIDKYIKSLILSYSFQKVKQIPATICGLHLRLSTTKDNKFIYYFKNNISLLEIHKVGMGKKPIKLIKNLEIPYF